MDNKSEKTTLGKARAAKDSAVILASLDTKTKNRVLKAIALQLHKNRRLILSENKKDVDAAKKSGINSAMLKRLMLSEDKITEMIQEVRSVMGLDDPVGRTLEAIELDTGLQLFKVTCPIGVIGAIFESRPDALVQIACLCFKSGNAVMLKGGTEAQNSNRLLARLIRKSTDAVAKGAIQLIESRSEVGEMLKLSDYIDLIIPRGSGSFVKYIQQTSSIPVLGHSEGVCHIYVDKDADLKKAMDICFDAKCQYPAVCNAMETMLVHKDIAAAFLPIIARKYKEAGVELRADDATRRILRGFTVRKVTEQDWKSEYNDLILSIRIVSSLDDAILHINTYGSRHSDGIITQNKENAQRFMQMVDSSSIMWNASTRFADGFRYGKGAEVGISTSKIHARGPVGLDGLVIYKYRLIGNGHIVKDYVGKNARGFTHRKISG